MTWISLVCLLALSSSAFANYGQSSGYGSALPRMSLLNAMRDNSIGRPVAPHGSSHRHHHHHQHKSLEQPSYGQQEQLQLQSGYGSSLLSAPRTLPTQGYGQQEQLQLQSGYGSSLLSAPKTLPTQGYGQINQGYDAVPRMIAFDQQQEVQPLPILTEADNLCRGKAPETIIPLEDNSRFVTCLDNGKGVEQSCPKGLFFHLPTQRCERKYGPQNYCAAEPCLNGGQCIPTDSSYQCQCAPGFDGQTCELDARICQTQSPCGQSQEARCQSFRSGAALQYICIFQGGLAYGLGAQQTVASPCQGVDGPQALAVSDKGFIMCDGERMFVESCPGGTIWDDSNKACVWPDMQTEVPQLDQSYSYGQSRQLINKPSYSYGGSFEQPKTIQGYGSQILQRPMHEQHKLIQGYGSFEQPKTIQGYGSQILQRPMHEQHKLVQGYGSFEQPKTIQGYGSQILQRPMHEQHKLVQGYGSFEQPKTFQGYGSQITIQPVAEQQKLTEGYGSQILQRPMNEQPKLVQGYGSQITIQPVAEQPKFDQGYGSQITIQPAAEQQKLTQGYGSQITIQPIAEQPKLVQSSGY